MIKFLTVVLIFLGIGGSSFGFDQFKNEPNSNSANREYTFKGKVVAVRSAGLAKKRMGLSWKIVFSDVEIDGKKYETYSFFTMGTYREFRLLPDEMSGKTFSFRFSEKVLGDGSVFLSRIEDLKLLND